MDVDRCEICDGMSQVAGETQVVTYALLKDGQAGKVVHDTK